jgi:mono/diheme cytochrome c family protein
MRDIHRRFFYAASTLLILVVLTAVTPAAEDPITILDRVYSVAQAERGESRFKESCASCHTLSEFAEPALSTRWEGQTLGDLYAFISTQMPEGAGGSLKSEEYASVIAYFLHISGFPVGRDDLPADKDVLKKIGIVSNPK